LRPIKLVVSLALSMVALSAGGLAATAGAAAAGGASSLTASNPDFGYVPVGRAGATTSVVVTNTGLVPVTIRTVSIVPNAGRNVSWFSVSSSCDGAALLPTQSCTLPATFAPDAIGDGAAVVHADVSDGVGSANPADLVLRGRTSGVPSDCLDGRISDSRDRNNPLLLSSRAHTAGASNPLQGSRFYVDHHKGLAIPYLGRYPQLHKIADQPENKRFSRYTAGGSPGGVESNVHKFICRVRDDDPNSIPTTSIYRIHHDHCGHASDSRREQGAYRSWINGLVRGIGRQPIVIFYEFDSLITVGCLSHGGLNARIGELRYGVQHLGALPHTVVYLDAGAADALSAGKVSRLLNKVGLGPIQGFFLNSTHYDWTSNEVAYGNRVSNATGHKHFVVSTSVNGRGPLRPRSRVHGGNEVLCNPPGRGLGIRPTTKTTSPAADAFTWIGNAGLSGGKCHHGDVGNGRFFLKYALGLVKRANEQYGPHTRSLPY
jgi:endoglucanase